MLAEVAVKVATEVGISVFVRRYVFRAGSREHDSRVMEIVGKESQGTASAQKRKKHTINKHCLRRNNRCFAIPGTTK